MTEPTQQTKGAESIDLKNRKYFKMDVPDIPFVCCSQWRQLQTSLSRRDLICKIEN